MTIDTHTKNNRIQKTSHLLHEETTWGDFAVKVLKNSTQAVSTAIPLNKSNALVKNIFCYKAQQK